MILALSHDLTKSIPFLDFGIALAAACVLIPVRSRYRKHTLRDAAVWMIVLIAQRVFKKTYISNGKRPHVVAH